MEGCPLQKGMRGPFPRTSTLHDLDRSLSTYVDTWVRACGTNTNIYICICLSSHRYIAHV